MKTITMTAWKRPDLTQQVLNSLAKCIGIENYKLLAFVEPGCEHVVELFDKFNACNKQIVVNKQVLGIAENTKQALNAAFEQGDYNIHIEDDTVLLPNALNFFEWCNAKYYQDKHIGTACAYSGNTSQSNVNDAIIHRWFGCWAWSTWKDRWEQSLKKSWGGDMCRFASHVNGWQFENKKLQIYPMQSLCINIGIGNALSTNGKNFKPDNIKVNDCTESISEFVIADRQCVSSVTFTGSSLSPSESVICVQYCNKVANAPTLLFGCSDGIIMEHINITKGASAKQAIFNYDVFPEAAFDVIIVAHPTNEKTQYLRRSGYVRQYAIKDKVGIERWLRQN